MIVSDELERVFLGVVKIPFQCIEGDLALKTAKGESVLRNTQTGVLNLGSRSQTTETSSTFEVYLPLS